MIEYKTARNILESHQLALTRKPNPHHCNDIEWCVIRIYNKEDSLDIICFGKTILEVLETAYNLIGEE